MSCMLRLPVIVGDREPIQAASCGMLQVALWPPIPPIPQIPSYFEPFPFRDDFRAPLGTRRSTDGRVDGNRLIAPDERSSQEPISTERQDPLPVTAQRKREGGKVWS